MIGADDLAALESLWREEVADARREIVALRAELARLAPRPVPPGIYGAALRSRPLALDRRA